MTVEKIKPGEYAFHSPAAGVEWVFKTERDAQRMSSAATKATAIRYRKNRK